MSRVNIMEQDECGGPDKLVGWFDGDRCTAAVAEGKRWDGSNMVSLAPGCGKWVHEHLLLTASGRWVLNHWSQWQGSTETYRYITDDEARTWMLANERDEECEEYFGTIEPERGPGRPEIGAPINVRLGSERLAAVDAAAAEAGVTRADMIRLLLSKALQPTPWPTA